ncbi:MlaD family protein [Nocardioides sp. WS12]|uniref:MlaD family protein n=1 Tax=Nocardioides sp. WS12 TaxID=2486272 RepID=UPI0015FBB7C5|nr:MlaD family protein [Nocardioides sp. WS12]
MRIPYTVIPRLRAVTVIAFISACTLLFGYLWINMGGRLPLVSSDGYRVSFESKDVDNLVYDSDVMVAGVRVGKVRQLDAAGGTAKVVLQIDEAAAMPLHEGARLHLRSKSLIEETYVEIVDGSGAELPDGATLPADALVPSVQLDDLLASLDKGTRADLSASLQSLGASTEQTGDQIAQTLTGLGNLGREGYDVLDALEAQSQDLQQLVSTSSRVMTALDSGQGRIVDLVEQAGLLTSSTASQKSDIEATVRALPGVLSTAREATTQLSVLAKDLRPVTKGINGAAPALTRALAYLPATTRDLRGLLPSLDATLDKAPATLERVPDVAKQLVRIIPTTRAVLADVNPMLAFMKPYGPDLGAFIGGWSAMLGNSDVNGHYLRIMPVLNEGSLKGNPLPLNTGILDKSNGYPKPGESRNPGPFKGTYPHVERDEE